MTVSERAARGKAARAQASRSSHADWAPGPGRRPLDVLKAQAADRVPDLVPIRHGRMLESPFTFYRGAAAIMAADLAGTPDSGFRVQLCGDAHLLNFGGFASPERDLVFDLNDFDETAPGPWEWDVKRLVASMAVAGRELGLPEASRRGLAEAAARGYREAMRRFAGMTNLEVWYARANVAGLIAAFGERISGRERKAVTQRIAKAHTKDHLRALAKLAERSNGSLRIVSQPPLIVPVEELFDTAGEEGAEEQMRIRLAAYRRSLSRDRRQLLDQYRYVHMARKVVGVGSVGTRAWVVLFTGRDSGDPLFLQVKEAAPSVLEPYNGATVPRHNGQRVVEGQRLMQATSDIFLGWLRSPGVDDARERDFYVRQLWDWKVSADVGAMAPSRLALHGELCGWTVARAHARTGDRIAIAAYLGAGPAFDRALATFAEAYAEQNERDHAALAAAVAEGDVAATVGV
jgi:uncharacterized protein (DUF2252 family)